MDGMSSPHTTQQKDVQNYNTRIFGFAFWDVARVKSDNLDSTRKQARQDRNLDINMFYS